MEKERVFYDRVRKQLKKLYAEKREFSAEIRGMHYHLQEFIDSQPNTLILGDGNFSFALAYCTLFQNRKVSATVLESDRDEFVTRYGPSALQILKELSASPERVHAHFGVDATKASSFPQDFAPYERIIMNFPHHGGKTNIKKARLLLSGIFQGVSQFMRSNNCCSATTFHLSLVKQQTEFRDVEYADLAETSQFIDEFQHNRDSWQALYLAAEHQLQCIRTRPFNIEYYPHYSPSGYKKTHKGFHNTYGLTFVFKLQDFLISLPSHFSPLVPYYEHHFSFVALTNDSEVFHGIHKSVHNLAPKMHIICDEMKQMRTFDPEGRENRIFRVLVQNPRATTRKECAVFVDDLRVRIARFLEAANCAVKLT